jgi:Uma2 family endonuclease
MVAVVTIEPSEQPQHVFRNVPWKTYVLLREAIDEPHLKMTYCRGVLEITSPLPPHEIKKSHLARLLELYAYVMRIELHPYGSTTFKNVETQRGVEPDECWCVGAALREVPDIVLEVIEMSPLLDKLVVYDGLGVPEVWLLDHGKLTPAPSKGEGRLRRRSSEQVFPEARPQAPRALSSTSLRQRRSRRVRKARETGRSPPHQALRPMIPSHLA